MKFLPSSDDERREMLAAIGVGTVEELFRDVPPEVRLRGKPDLPDPRSEIEIRRELGRLAGRNAHALSHAHFLGAGCYYHYLPAIADQTLYREEWLSSYTPYQPEISQGTLQSIFEWQTHLALLTGMEVANASLYEGATALVEALLMASRLVKGRRRAVVSKNIHPDYLETAKTYFHNVGLDLVEVEDEDLDAA
ncbi:MAG: glycine dehydrogenase, partial [Thermoanaerobaculia bacterium]